jgi:hypothetical protein
MKLRALALCLGITLAGSLGMGAVSAQTESATAEDGKSANEVPVEAVAVPNVPIGANLTPPVGLVPPTLPINSPAGTGQSGSSTVSMAPGSLTSGVAREGRNAVRAPEEPAAAPADTAAVAACTDFPTWYDAQLALESSVNAAVIASLDPDADTIACEEVMYPDS